MKIFHSASILFLELVLVGAILMYIAVSEIYLTLLCHPGYLEHLQNVIRGSSGLTHGFVERGERGRAVHAGKVLCAQSRLVKD